jgi:NlpC/P60 family putative phage cell wall peptidase
VWRELLGAEPVRVPAYAPDWSEARREEALWEAARRHLVAREVPGPGDVLLFRMRDRSVAKHLGILTEGGARPRFIHAYSGHGVVENSLSEPWRRRIVATFAFPGGAD